MKIFTRTELAETERRKRANLINSLSGYKPANLIGTISGSGVHNLAIFTSVVHIGADPPLLGFVMRPIRDAPRHTYQNIKSNGYFTINHVHESFADNAHFTSAKFADDESEFDHCGLTPEFLSGFTAPFVAESKVKMGLRLVEEIPVTSNDTILMIGEIEILSIPEFAQMDDGSLDLNVVNDVCVSGLDTYHAVSKIMSLPYAKRDNLPSLEK
jgi:flavin reductase (DIM6/NTAB) family NADH-FMN oxidoreductase RutF